MTMKDPNYKLLTEAAVQLQDYLLSDELFWPLSGNLPRLTPGSLLLSLEFAKVSFPYEAERFQLNFNLVRSKWKEAWIKKCDREILNRIRLWSQYLQEATGDSSYSMESYRTQVRGRVIVQLLLSESNRTIENKELQELENKLRRRLIPGEFIWDHIFENSFPSSNYWFLYGTI